MEELLSLAQRGGLEQDEGEAVVGALLSVLKQSKNLEKDIFEKQILAKIEGGSDALKKHERKEFRKNLPNPATMLLPRPAFAPPGPPPPIVLKAAANGIGRALRKDKDASNTQDAIKDLSKRGIEKEKVLAFVPVFVLYVQEKTATDVSQILRLPPDDEKK